MIPIETTNQETPQTWWEFMRHNFPLRQFIVGAIIPAVIFYVFHRLDRPLMGALLASGWGTGLIIITHLFFKRINLFAALSIPFILIELVGTIITLNPEFYLASSAIEKTLFGLVFLGSSIISRPLIQIFAEAMGSLPKQKAFGDFGSSELFRSTWFILTNIWGMAYLSAAILLVLSQIFLPLETFLIIRTVFGFPKTALLMGFSFWFPGWYWNRSLVGIDQKVEIQE